MISYFFKVFQFFAAVCFNRHLLTFWILACLHTARNAPWKWMHLIFFVPTSCVSGADRKLIHLLQKTLFVCVYANSSLPVPQPSSFVTRSTRVIDSSRPSLHYRSEIQFLLCFIWRSVIPLKRKPEPDMFIFGWSLFARFSGSPVGLEPSEKTTTNLPWYIWFSLFHRFELKLT